MLTWVGKLRQHRRITGLEFKKTDQYKQYCLDYSKDYMNDVRLVKHQRVTVHVLKLEYDYNGEGADKTQAGTT